MTEKKAKISLLVVDDAPDTLEVLERILSAAGYRVHTSSSVVDAIGVLEGTPVDLVVTDMKMPAISGLDLVRYVRENLEDTEVMMITGYATIEGAVEAVKIGAEEYLAKPFTDDELLEAVERVLEKLDARRAAREKPAQISSGTYGIVGESPVMQEVFHAISKAAGTTATVLITGESGTGKELIGRAIHYHSARSSGPFVPINCGAIPGELVESELFGHVKGAFTGAIGTKQGFFQAAADGSIFLDEIGETSPSTQVKLLRVLDDKEVLMVGSTSPKKVDVRILTATNKDLLSLVEKEKFREDLYFRLGVITVTAPPLRERGNDILLLLTHFANKYASHGSRDAPVFTDRALEALKHYSWPGNVRELQNLVQRLIVMKAGQKIDVPDLPAHMRFSVARTGDVKRSLAEVEADHIRNVLASVDGNKTRAAEILGIDRKTLREKLRNPTRDSGE